MSQQVIAGGAQGDQVVPAQKSKGHGSARLGAFLCWAVVFADIGTSVYYVPGILYGQFGTLAGLFVTLTLVAFVLLALKYAEVSVRFPEGGGVVTVSSRALNPWFGALGGMFILVDYFLTAAISSLSGLQYLQDVFPRIQPFVLIATIIVLVLLGVLNWWGIKESASVSAVIAVVAFISDIVIIVAVLLSLSPAEIGQILSEVFRSGHLTGLTLITGFAGAFLAFSGLESISQLSPVMRTPRRKTVAIALGLVVITVGITSPLLTIFSTTLLDGHHAALLPHAVQHIDPNQFISQLGGAFAGPVIGIATAITASALLIFASNTAIIGSYHVFLALSHMSFFPRVVERLDPRRQTPIISIILATVIPITILIVVQGQIDLLGQLYAFGLLGAFSLTCISLDVLRFRERIGRQHWMPHSVEDEEPALTSEEEDEEDELVAQSSARALWRRVVLWTDKSWPTINFALGILTTLLVIIAWTTNLISKRDATIFGSSLTIVGMAIAITHRRWQERHGTQAIFVRAAAAFSPESILVLTHSGSHANRRVIESAFRAARGRQVHLLYLAAESDVHVGVMQIADPTLSREAQTLFRQANELGRLTESPVDYFYRIGTTARAELLWRATRSHEVVADAQEARLFARRVAPAYIRYNVEGDVRVAHLIMPLAEQPAMRIGPMFWRPFTTPATSGAARPAANGHNGHTGPTAGPSGPYTPYDIEDEEIDLSDFRERAPSVPVRNQPNIPEGMLGDAKPRYKVKMVPDRALSGPTGAPYVASTGAAGGSREPVKPTEPKPPIIEPPQKARIAGETDEDDEWEWVDNDLVRRDRGTARDQAGDSGE